MRTDKSPTKLFLLLALALCGLLVLAPGAVFADDDDDDGSDFPSDPEDPFPVKCVAKVVCGFVTSPAEGTTAEALQRERLVGAGVYRTSVNIVNLGAEAVDIQKKYVRTANETDEPESENPGSELVDHFGLASMAGFDVDCSEISEEFFGSELDLEEGFLFLQSSGPIHVTAVYTAGQANVIEQTECGDPVTGAPTETCVTQKSQGVRSIDVETIACRTVKPRATGCDSGECDD